MNTRFCVLLLPLCVAGGAAGQPVVEEFGHYRQLFYRQSSVAPPTEPDLYISYMEFEGDNLDFDRVLVQRPGDLPVITLTPPDYLWRRQFETLEEYNQNLPAGPYTFTAIRHGQVAGTGVIPDGPAFYPDAVPAVTPETFKGLQNIDPTRDFTITYNGWNTNPAAMTNLTVVQVINITPWHWVGGVTTWPENTTFTIPAHTMRPGVGYVLGLYYTSEIDIPDAGFSGASASQSYNTLTFITFQALDLCDGDFNGDGFVNSQDLFEFIPYFFDQSPGTDFNNDGVVDSQDLFAFLLAFFGSC